MRPLEGEAFTNLDEDLVSGEGLQLLNLNFVESGCSRCTLALEGCADVIIDTGTVAPDSGDGGEVVSLESDGQGAFVAQGVVVREVVDRVMEGVDEKKPGAMRIAAGVLAGIWRGEDPCESCNAAFRPLCEMAEDLEGLNQVLSDAIER